MAIRIGMNGFGRIGRYLARLLIEDRDLELAVVNARADNATYAHLLAYDSVFGRYSGEVTHNDQGLVVNGQQITVTRWPDPHSAAWGDYGCDIVVEASGKFVDRESCQAHLSAGARKVVVSAPAKGHDVTVCPNVNDHAFDPREHSIVSSASCTTNSLAPVVKVLNDRFGVKHGLMTTIHSYTMTQRLLDGSHKDLRRGRAAAVSQIPTTTGAAKAVIEILPEMAGKLDGMAVRVPTPCGSLTDLVCELETGVDRDVVNNAFREAANETLGYSEEPLVSVDYIGDTHGVVIDAQSTMVMDSTMAKVLAWYDNESGFSNQLLRLIRLVAARL
jgi:glyceraldehyde 3-phosphate dehydrogenase